MTKLVYVVQLIEGEFQVEKDEILYIKQDTDVRFICGSKLNYFYIPFLLSDRKIKRKIYEQKKFQNEVKSKITKEELYRRYKPIPGRLNPEGYWIADKAFRYMGPISLQMIFCREENDYYIIEHCGKEEQIIVEPKNMELSKMIIMSVFPRCIGTADKWKSFFEKQMELGYNAFHFPPIQQLGSSNSYYSIQNQLELSTALFKSNNPYSQLQEIVSSLNKKGAFFFVDIVLNHTSYDSKWLIDNEDAAYTTKNSPSLVSTFIVDEIIYQWGELIKQNYKNQFITEQMIDYMIQSLINQLKKLNLWEFFQIDNSFILILLQQLKPGIPSSNLRQDPINFIIKFIEDNLTNLGASRFGVTVSNLQEWENTNIIFEDENIITAVQNINKQWRTKVQIWIQEIRVSLKNQMRNTLLNKKLTIIQQRPLVQKAFSRVNNKYYALNNGWVAGCNPLQNFAISNNFYYLRRKVNVWGDLIKLRYGQSKKDSPKLWDHMQLYIQFMAKHFNGFRLDNCHGTPLQVGEYFMRKARKVNPNIMIFAELFTNNRQQDAIFIKKMGMNALVKQSIQMLQAKNFVGHFYNHSGKSSLHLGTLDNQFIKGDQRRIFTKPRRPLYLVYDVSHDNLTYNEMNCIQKQLPMVCLLSFLDTCIGTTKGFDQYYKKKIDVIESNQIYQNDECKEPQKYKVEEQFITLTFPRKHRIKNVKVMGSWDGWKTQLLLQSKSKNFFQTRIKIGPGIYQYKFIQNQTQYVTDKLKPKIGFNQNHQVIILEEAHSKLTYYNLQGVRKSLSMLRRKYQQYVEIYMKEINNTVQIIKSYKQKDKSIMILASLSNVNQQVMVELPGIASACLIWNKKNLVSDQVIESYWLPQFFDIKLSQNNKPLLVTTDLPPGFACIIQCQIDQNQLQSLNQTKTLLNQKFQFPILCAPQINQLMFGITKEQEQRQGFGNYVVPNQGQLIYGGFGGVYRYTKKAMKENNLSCQLFQNLRNGDWLFEYYINRLAKNKKLSKIRQHMDDIFSAMKCLPRYKIPYFFSKFIVNFVEQLKNSLACDEKKFVRTQFTKNLILASTQFFCRMGKTKNQLFQVTLAAGLPHFATGWTRAWGRDTFTSTQLLLLHPQNFRKLILGFASAMRHCLIPNLLDNGNNPRYNSRDSTWWFVRAVKQYVISTSDYAILKQPVKMIFLSDDISEHKKLHARKVEKIKQLEVIIHEIFQSYYPGIHFRQWNAGMQIDSNMRNNGFNIDLKLDQGTGFIIGGSTNNCLTWMDKMGSSHKAKSKGIPASSRNGAPVELVALLKNCLDGYTKLYKEGKFSFNSITIKDKEFTYQQWSDLIQTNFEKWFWIPSETQKDTHKSIQQAYIKHRGMYKDVVKSYIPYEQYRLRPNALVAISLAPELFTIQNAKKYVDLVQSKLINNRSLGVGTLDKIEQEIYSPEYDNDDDSNNYIKAHGFSYHNGPQWVWLYGYYIKALLIVKNYNIPQSKAMALLQNHIKHIKNDYWMSLPELTDINGKFNKFSCTAQAWSISSMLLAVEEIHKLKDTAQQL